MKAHVLFFGKKPAGERPWMERFRAISYDEIVEDLTVALAEFEAVAAALEAGDDVPTV